MCACINHEQVRMDNVLFIPPPPFFEGTRAEFDTTLEDCWYGRVVLLFRIRVKLDKKDGDEVRFRWLQLRHDRVSLRLCSWQVRVC